MHTRQHALLFGRNEVRVLEYLQAKKQKKAQKKHLATSRREVILGEQGGNPPFSKNY